MLLNLPVYWLVGLNIAGWLVIQLGLAWLFVRLPSRWFEGPSRADRNGWSRWYERWFFIRHWKRYLPDGGSWLGSDFQKRTLPGRDTACLERFVLETRRGEVCHWCALALSPVFAIWNPGWYFGVNLAYAILANLPCILVQRYNRNRLSDCLSHRG